MAIPLAKFKMPIEGMPGVAWEQDGFYEAGTGVVHMPELTKPLDDATALAMRRGYYSAVTWMDVQLGKCIDEIAALGLEVGLGVFGVFWGVGGWS